MSTCITPDCGYQHGLIDGLCCFCEFGDRLAVLDDEDFKRVLNRSQRTTVRPEFGSTPHDDRVLPVVLVVATRDFGVPSRVHRVEPNSAHADTFWQDIGRPGKGTEKHAEAPIADVCVQRACPTGAEQCPPGLCRLVDWGPASACDDCRFHRGRQALLSLREAHLTRLELIGPLPEPCDIDPFDHEWPRAPRSDVTDALVERLTYSEEEK